MYKSYSWLPDITTLADFSGDFNLFIDRLYKIFEKDLKPNQIFIDGIRVNCCDTYNVNKLETDCVKYFRNGCNNTLYKCHCFFKPREKEFNHLMTKGQNIFIPPRTKLKNKRPGVFDEERAMRIAWIRPILINYSKYPSDILYFESGNAPNIEKHYWLKAEDFIVILRNVERPNKKTLLILTTAHYIDRDDARIDYENKYINYSNSL